MPDSGASSGDPEAVAAADSKLAACRAAFLEEVDPFLGEAFPGEEVRTAERPVQAEVACDASSEARRAEGPGKWGAVDHQRSVEVRSSAAENSLAVDLLDLDPPSEHLHRAAVNLRRALLDRLGLDGCHDL